MKRTPVIVVAGQEMTDDVCETLAQTPGTIVVRHRFDGHVVVRSVRMLGIQNALMQVLMQGQRLKVEKAKSVGIIDEVVDSQEEMLAKARESFGPRNGRDWRKAAV